MPDTIENKSNLQESVDSFLNYMMVERGVSPNTLVAYRNDLSQLVDYLENTYAEGRGFDWSQVDDQVLTAYLLRLHDQGYSDTTRARKIASAKSLFGFLLDEGTISKDPT